MENTFSTYFLRCKSMRNFHKPHATSMTNNHYSTVITNVSLATTSQRWEELCRLSLIDGFQTQHIGPESVSITSLRSLHNEALSLSK